LLAILFFAYLGVKLIDVKDRIKWKIQAVGRGVIAIMRAPLDYVMSTASNAKEREEVMTKEQNELYAEAGRALGMSIDEIKQVVEAINKLNPTAQQAADAMRNTTLVLRKIKKEHKPKYVNKHHKRYSNRSRW